MSKAEFRTLLSRVTSFGVTFLSFLHNIRAAAERDSYDLDEMALFSSSIRVLDVLPEIMESTQGAKPAIVHG